MFQVRDFKKDDFDAVSRIFQQGIDTGDATFLTEGRSWPDWDAAYLKDCRLVLEEDGRVAGYGVLSPFSSMPAYRGVAETSIYIDAAVRGRGAGRILLSHLIAASEAAGLWTLQAKIFPENDASIRLHKAQGFRVVGTFEKVGKLNGHWRDVTFLERRSPLL